MCPFVILCDTIIALCVPMIAYLLPQDPMVTRVVAAVTRRRRRRRQRRWVAQQRQVRR